MVLIRCKFILANPTLSEYLSSHLKSESSKIAHACFAHQRLKLTSSAHSWTWIVSVTLKASFGACSSRALLFSSSSVSHYCMLLTNHSSVLVVLALVSLLLCLYTLVNVCDSTWLPLKCSDYKVKFTKQKKSLWYSVTDIKMNLEENILVSHRSLHKLLHKYHQLT